MPAVEPMKDMKRAFAAIDAFVEQQIESSGIPGVALAVTDREQTLHLSAFGFADVASEQPVVPDTLFEIGSITKSFTVIVLMQLHEAGRVDLNAPVSQYLPWFRVQSRHRPITLHHLMSHTGGIIEGTDFTGEALHEVWALRETEAAAPPGTYFHYSNVGYKALGLVLEQILEQPYGDIIRQRVLDPLGMTASEPIITHDTRRRLAVGYDSYYDDRPTHPNLPLVPATWIEYSGGDGSIAAPVADMAAYTRLWLNRGRGPSGQLVSRESFDLMAAPVIESTEGEDRQSHYGYGLFVLREEEHTLITHSGGMIGYFSSVLCDMDDGLGIVVLVNGPGEPDDIAEPALRAVSDALHRRDLASLPQAPDRTRVSDAADYAGTYRSANKEFELRAVGERLLMLYCSDEIALEQRGKDRFYVPHRGFSLFLLYFEREGDRVVAAHHGADWYGKDGYAGHGYSRAPAQWEAYVGHYRCHNPWYTNFRVVLRRGRLVFILPGGEEHPLTLLDDHVFRVGEDDSSPERIRFGTFIDGRASTANLSGCPYYRTFTP